MIVESEAGRVMMAYSCHFCCCLQSARRAWYLAMQTLLMLLLFISMAAGKRTMLSGWSGLQ